MNEMAAVDKVAVGMYTLLVLLLLCFQISYAQSGYTELKIPLRLHSCHYLSTILQGLLPEYCQVQVILQTDYQWLSKVPLWILMATSMQKVLSEFL